MVGLDPVHCSSPCWTLPSGLCGVAQHTWATDKPQSPGGDGFLQIWHVSSTSLVSLSSTREPVHQGWGLSYLQADLRGCQNPTVPKRTSGDDTEWHQKLHAPG